jgi:hypothetical protein
MKVVIDDSQLQELIKDTSIADRAAVIFARKVVKSASFALEKRIKREMPVGNPSLWQHPAPHGYVGGRARSSWGHGNESIWREVDGGLSIEQGSNVVYIEPLNRGHSTQAPAGFIDRAFVVAEFEMTKELGLFDPLDPNGAGVQLPLF